MVLEGALPPVPRERYGKVKVYGSTLRERRIESTPLSACEGERLWFRDRCWLLLGVTDKSLKSKGNR